MFQIRVHGRGGQGVVTAAELLSVAAFDSGRHAQAIPSFGSERTGAPVVAFCRIDDRPIRLREPVLEPDALIIADPTLLTVWTCSRACGPTGTCCSTRRGAGRSWGSPSCTIGCPTATHASCPRAGWPRPTSAARVPNAALLGGFAAMTGLVSLGSVEAAIRDRFPARIADGNVKAAAEAYDVESTSGIGEVAHA